MTILVSSSFLFFFSFLARFFPFLPLLVQTFLYFSLLFSPLFRVYVRMYHGYVPGVILLQRYGMVYHRSI